MDNGLSLADAMALQKDDDNGMNGWFWIIILFLFIFGNGGGFGGANNAAAQGALTRAELSDGLTQQTIQNNQATLRDAIGAQNLTNLQSINDTQNILLNGFNNSQLAMLEGFNGIQSSIAQNGFNAQQCCCETNRNIDSVKAENYKNTCEITTAIHSEGEATRALITANVMQELRDQLQAAQLQLGNSVQTQTLIATLRPYPIPAYQSCSPYVSTGCNCGC